MTIDDYIANLPCGRPAAGLGPGNPPKPYPPLELMIDRERMICTIEALTLVLTWYPDAGELSPRARGPTQ